jgi:hypothetical protein
MEAEFRQQCQRDVRMGSLSADSGRLRNVGYNLGKAEIPDCLRL